MGTNHFYSIETKIQEYTSHCFINYSKLSTASQFPVHCNIQRHPWKKEYVFMQWKSITDMCTRWPVRVVQVIFTVTMSKQVRLKKHYLTHIWRNCIVSTYRNACTDQLLNPKQRKNPLCRTVFLNTNVISRGLTSRYVMWTSIPWPKQIGTSTETWRVFVPLLVNVLWKSPITFPLCTRISQILTTSTTRNIDRKAVLHLGSVPFHFSPFLLLFLLHFPQLLPFASLTSTCLRWGIFSKL